MRVNKASNVDCEPTTKLGCIVYVLHSRTSSEDNTSFNSLLIHVCHIWENPIRSGNRLKGNQNAVFHAQFLVEQVQKTTRSLLIHICQILGKPYQERKQTKGESKRCLSHAVPSRTRSEDNPFSIDTRMSYMRKTYQEPKQTRRESKRLVRHVQKTLIHNKFHNGEKIWPPFFANKIVHGT